MRGLARSVGFVLLFSPLVALASGPVYTVNTPFDFPDAAINGICDTGDTCNGSPCCTLRAALMEANLGPGAGVDEATIHLPAGTYHLTIPIGDPDSHGNGDLNVLDTVRVHIAGVGSDLSIIDASQIADRVLFVGYGATVTLSDLRIQGGRPPLGALRTGAGRGGGIYNDRASLTLLRCLVRDNQTKAEQDGGGIYSDHGALSIVESAVRVNVGSHGGGISSVGATTAIVRSTVNGNAATYGGGIFQDAGAIKIVNSTISTNGAALGGGIYVYNAYVADATAFNNATTAANTTSDNLLSSGANAYFDTSAIVLSNSIFDQGTIACAGNQTTVSSNGYNMLWDNHNCTIAGSWISTDPFINTLGELGLNGGLTVTHALAKSSLAVDAGDPAGCVDPLGQGSTLGTDQRGVKRPIGAGCDLGAFEVEPQGDANGDGARDVADVFYIINYLFAGGPVPHGRANVNGDSAIDVADVFYLINYLFAGGPAPV
jgi:hypothetical protein